ncbi:MAG: DUF2007 domain-containing protein [Phycisphaeraceae bacterium]|nr:DUF2007 domain-containing protein [Phycisphaeraceae bacterium]
MDKPYVTIEQFDNILHAELAQIRLEEAGIPVYLHNRNIVWADPLLSNAVGNIKVQVPAEDRDRAVEVIASIREKIVAMFNQPKPIEEDDAYLNCGESMPEDLDTCGHCGWSYADDDAAPNPESI